MEELPHGYHGNFPKRRATLLPQVAKYRVQQALVAMSSGTSPIPATTTGAPSLLTKQLGSTRLCGMEMELNQPWHCKVASSRVASSSSEKAQRHPAVIDKDVAALLKRIRIHPEAQRILGKSCIAIVHLERLNFQTVSLSSMQPVVSLVRLPKITKNVQKYQKCVQLHDEVCLDHPQQNGFSQHEADISEIREESSQSQPAESSCPSQPEATAMSWIEPYCPDSSSSGAQEPEEDSGFDCESNSDQLYILFESESEGDPDLKMDSETFYLDPDPEQNIVIELDPEGESDHDRSPEVEDECETRSEVDLVQMDDSGGQNVPSCSLTQEECDASSQQTVAETEEMESEDFCAVCLNGGDLLCCDRCPKVFHLACHIPPLTGLPMDDWVCSLCRTNQDTVEAYECENVRSCGGVNAPYTLSNLEQRRCEKLTLLLSCHILSAPFHEPVSPLARNYYQVIKRPIDLSVIRRKLDKSNTLHYFTAEQFVDDVLLMFKNCATFNYPDSEVAQAGRNLEVFFLSKLEEIFPDQTFPSASQEKTDRARLQWLNKKRRENCKKKRYVFHGKKYVL